MIETGEPKYSSGAFIVQHDPHVNFFAENRLMPKFAIGNRLFGTIFAVREFARIGSIHPRRQDADGF